MMYDVVIAGGGPAGLAAALALGRGRKRVLLCDAGPRRNAAAVHVQTFVTRDGITPGEFRRVAREQLRPYASVEVRDERVEEITGASGRFAVRLGAGSVEARRVLLCTGLIDELPPLEGLRELWGTSVFQCPYCHGWEVRDRRFGYLAAGLEACEFALLLRGWTSDVVLFTDGGFDLPAETAARLAAGGVRMEERRIRRLAGSDGRLASVEVADGASVPCDALFMHPPQRQVGLVLSLGLALDAQGLIVVDETRMQSSAAGIYAAGDIITRSQSALLAAASGMRAAAALNHELTAEMATTGALP